LSSARPSWAAARPVYERPCPDPTPPVEFRSRTLGAPEDDPGRESIDGAELTAIMPLLQRLCADHAPAVLAFEVANRAYFAASISDRGDEFFDRFSEQFNALLADQEAGGGAYYVLVADDGSVLGRFNLIFVDHATANLGYRVAQRAAGQGVATATVAELSELAVRQHGLLRLRAATSHQNIASQKVLLNTGFVAVGPADPADIGGKTGTRYERALGAT
jgi:ribosomal-protein-alanine N-acetyltransferase